MKYSLCSCVTLVLCFIGIKSDDTSNLPSLLLCPDNYNLIAGKCYRFDQTQVNWGAAQSACEQEGAHLASVMTDQEYTDILQHINENYAGTYWISGAPVGNIWIWTSEGVRMNGGWFGRSPSDVNKCAYFCSNTHKYWDSNCSNNKRFICEIKLENPDCTPLSVDPEIDLRALERLNEVE